MPPESGIKSITLPGDGSLDTALTPNIVQTLEKASRLRDKVENALEGLLG